MKHGADTLSYKYLYKGDIIDFSSNINPLGHPKGLKECLNNSMQSLLVYPDIKYRELRQEIAKYIDCRAEEVIVSNGAIEIINNFIMLFKRIIVCAPAFSEYKERALINGKEVLTISLKNNFEITDDLFIDTLKEGDLIILGNPNNPTGKRIRKEILENLHIMAVEKGAFLLLDEAFFEFCPEDYDSIKILKDSKNVCIIRAATKFFALPGIRLGYAYTNCEFVKKYNEVSLPWTVNAFADAAGRFILKDKKYIKESKKYIEEQRNLMLKELKKIDNIEVFDTDANFILLKLLKSNEDRLFSYLISNGIMIRKASSFEGLDNTYVRIAIKSYEDNKKLLSLLKLFS